ncbi:hypothetical protein GCM10010207_31950 [Streptomyces atratus]|nr:hypothetical protein GCM10010207_31950 [Streptomyces atratus]
MAFVIGLWILMYLLEANRGNDLVNVVRHTARRPADWSYDLSTFEEAWARVVSGYGPAAVVHLFVGHAVAGRIRRREGAEVSTLLDLSGGSARDRP